MPESDSTCSVVLAGRRRVTPSASGDQRRADARRCRQRKFNRVENVRQIPPGDPDHETLYKRRNDAESINPHLDDTIWLRRAHSVW
jgi:hypothetical protein